MDEHTVHSYGRDLELLAARVVEMGGPIKELFQLMETTLHDPEEKLIAEAKAIDKRINALDLQIESGAIAILALRQPLAIDLRFVVSVLKITVIMERIGDLAKNAIRRAAKNNVPSHDSIHKNIKKMLKIIEEMLEQALEAFQEENEEKAREVVMRDGEVDVIYRQLMSDIQAEMMANSASIPACMQSIFIIKNFERIGDYVTKTAKLVHYIVLGERAPKIAKKP